MGYFGWLCVWIENALSNTPDLSPWRYVVRRLVAVGVCVNCDSLTNIHCSSHAGAPYRLPDFLGTCIENCLVLYISASMFSPQLATRGQAETFLTPFRVCCLVCVFGKVSFVRMPRIPDSCILHSQVDLPFLKHVHQLGRVQCTTLVQNRIQFTIYCILLLLVVGFHLLHDLTTEPQADHSLG